MPIPTLLVHDPGGPASVVGTSKAVEGLPVQDRVHAHVANTPADFTRRLEEVALEVVSVTPLLIHADVVERCATANRGRD